jgi:aryl-alcohol dehydrogenase-like predicted oxidoreductase
MPQKSEIHRRQFGETGLQVSTPGLGGHHLGNAEDGNTAKEIVASALDSGVTLFDHQPVRR